VTETDPATGTEIGIETDIETVRGTGTTDFAMTGVEMVIVTIEGTTVAVPAHETVETGPLPLLPPTLQSPHHQKKSRKGRLHP
jgi:hypothetical protein